MANAALLVVALALALARAEAACCGGMTMNAAGLALTQASEGFVDHVYNDAAGNPTVCYGHLVKAGETFPNPVPMSQCVALLKQDLASAEACVRSHVNVPLNSNQFSALVDFTYNLGCGTLQTSTLLSLLNQGQYSAVPAQMARFVYAGGKVLPGLVTRRNAEGALWNKAASGTGTGGSGTGTGGSGTGTGTGGHTGGSGTGTGGHTGGTGTGGSGTGGHTGGGSGGQTGGGSGGSGSHTGGATANPTDDSSGDGGVGAEEDGSGVDAEEEGSGDVQGQMDAQGTASASTSKSSKFPAFAIALIVLGCVAIVAGVGIAVYVQKAKASARVDPLQYSLIDDRKPIGGTTTESIA